MAKQTKTGGDMRIEYVALSTIQRWPRNPKLHADAVLDASLDRFGYVAPVLRDEGTGRLVAGHGRVDRLVARKVAGKDPPDRIKVRRGEWLVPVICGVSFASPAEAEAYLLADNQTTVLGGWGPEIVGFLERARESQRGFEGLGFTPADLRGFKAQFAASPTGAASDDGPQIDPTEALRAKWGVEKGQLREVVSADGARTHRVLCGDCRKADDVARLLDGRKVSVAFTSPPYASQRKYDEESGFTPIPPDEYVEWFEPVQANVHAHLAPDGSWFVNIKEHCDDGERHLYVKDLTIAHKRRWGWMFMDEFCWRDTKNGVPGGWQNRFKDAWEPVFQFTFAKRAKFRPDNVSTHSDQCFSSIDAKSGTGSGLLGPKGPGSLKSGLARPSNVIEAAASGASDGHEAAFPIALPSFFIRAFSDIDDATLDPFLGSGTTLLAAEQHGRVGFGIEISPKYVAVTLERLSRAGLKPRLVAA